MKKRLKNSWKKKGEKITKNLTFTRWNPKSEGESSLEVGTLNSTDSYLNFRIPIPTLNPNRFLFKFSNFYRYLIPADKAWGYFDSPKFRKICDFPIFLYFRRRVADFLVCSASQPLNPNQR